MLQEQGVAGVVVSTSTWHASGPGNQVQYLVTAVMVYLVYFKIWL